MPNITITLSADRLQFILNLLAERPFKEVADIIQTIMDQSKPQAEAAQPAATEVSGG